MPNSKFFILKMFYEYANFRIYLREYLIIRLNLNNFLIIKNLIMSNFIAEN